MDTEKERAKILEMVSEGKITAEEGVKLLNALHGAAREERSGRAPRWVRMRVTDTTTERAKVNMNLPFSIVEAAMSFGARFAPTVDEMNWDDLIDAIRGGASGRIVDIEDELRGEKIEVFVD